MATRPSTDVLPAGPAWFFHRRDGRRCLGIVEPKPLRCFDCGPHDELALLASGGLGASALSELSRRAMAMEPGAVRWDVPVARPSKILCLGKNFAAHAREFGAEVPSEPIFFTKLVDTLLPHEAPVVLPHWLDSRIDHEIELAVVVGFDDPDGRGRKNVAPQDAMALVAGYTVLNDVTARKMQGDDRKLQHPWLRSKSFDTFCPVGPWVVPAESMPAELDLAIDLWVDDEHRQTSRTGLMEVDVPHAIAWLSRHTTLRPGDLIAMGTPEGVGPIGDGQQMLGAIEAIATLRNPVVREPRPD